jgi:long-chain acyl-CoA synthetase
MTTTSPAGRPVYTLPSVWGSGVVRDPDGPGLLYHPRPASIIEMLAGTRRWSERTFLVQGERRISFAVFLDAIPRAAALLGGRPGDRIFVLSYNTPEFVLALWSAWWASLPRPRQSLVE